MGLFINHHKHPEVFINNHISEEHNQDIHRKGFLAELLEEQQNTNASLNESLNELKQHNKKQEELQSFQWDDLNKQLNSFKQRDYEHHNMEKKMMERLKFLEENYKTIQTFLEKEDQLKKEIINELLLQNTVREEMAKKIEKYDALTKYVSQQIEKQQQNINEKMIQQEDFQTKILNRLEKQEELNQQLIQQVEIKQTNLEKDLTEKMVKQEDYQTEILTRLDKQEALTEKIARQINHIRSILFERTNFLAGKIEDGYKLTSTYVYKLLTGSETPLSFYTVKNQKEEN